MTNEGYKGEGSLTVRVTEGGGAFPIKDALVTVSSRDSDEGGGGILYSLTTDESGLTEKVFLPAPPKAETLYPSGLSLYSIYDIKVSRNGYTDAENAGVQIFDGVAAIQYFDMLPLSSQTSGGTRTNSQNALFNGYKPNLYETGDNEL